MYLKDKPAETVTRDNTGAAIDGNKFILKRKILVESKITMPGLVQQAVLKVEQQQVPRVPSITLSETVYKKVIMLPPRAFAELAVMVANSFIPVRSQNPHRGKAMDSRIFVQTDNFLNLIPPFHPLHFSCLQF